MDIIRSIKRLDPSVVSRIAAGEVVKRPANAVKEMIENSLDAKATSIQVVVKNGGMKYLQIVDNGVGIKNEDLELVCERFSTSKLENIDNMCSLNSYGFRGEALCSISHISHVSLKTKTVEDRLGYEISYSEGRPVGKPVRCAANQGTQITVENMFHNDPLRLKVLKNFNEEFKRIWDVVARYAVHNASVGFSLMKYGENNMSIKTMPNSSTIDVISSIFGADISRKLLEKKISDETLQFKCEILASNLNYYAPQLTFLLFINHRLVKAEGLQKEVVDLFSIYLPRKTYPFVYISLEMAPENVDVNVHPTKENVFYLYEESINNKIVTAIQKLIKGKDAYKIYREEALTLSQNENNQHTLQKPSSEKENFACKLERNELNITSFEKNVALSVKENSKVVDDPTRAKDSNDDLLYTDSDDSVIVTIDDFDIIQNNDVPGKSHKNDCEGNENSVLPITNLGALKINILDACDRQLKGIMEASVFVTCPDFTHMIIRKENLLYMCNLKAWCQEYFYQVMIKELGRCGRLIFKVPVPLMTLIQYAISLKCGSTEVDAQILLQRLMKNATILDNYYSIKIDENGNLKSLPQLLENYFPPKEFLPEFILRLARDVPWNKECPCIHELCIETACYYSKFPKNNGTSMSLGEWSSFVELTLFPNIKEHLLPSRKLFSKHITEILNISSFVDHG